jgi:predicted  nucleic acid-binding Zn-ribbon protein
MTEEKSVLDAAVEAMVDIYNRLEDAANGIWAVALELSKLNEKLDALTDKEGNIKVSIDYEKLGDQVAAALGQSLVETSSPSATEFPPVKAKQKEGTK